MAAAGARETARRPARLIWVPVAVVAASALAAVALPPSAVRWLLLPPGRLLFGGYLGAVMAHFVVDAGLWRLRDRFPRAFLADRVPYLVPASGRGQQHRSTMDRSPI